MDITMLNNRVLCAFVGMLLLVSPIGVAVAEGPGQTPTSPEAEARAAAATAAAAAAAAAAELRTRVDEAVKGYTDRMAANANKAQDDAIKLRENALLHDPESQIIGNPKGDVTLVQFFDYQCPFTKAVEPRLEAFLKSDSGVKLIVKEFPILTPESRVASEAALASVNQGKYAAFHQALLLHKGHLSEGDIWIIAKDVGLDVDKLRTDMNAPAIADEIISNMNLARQIKVTQTPTFIAHGHVVRVPSRQLDFAKLAAELRSGKE